MTSLRSSIPIPTDWVDGTDLILNLLVYKTGTGIETAIMSSWVSSLSDGETWSHSIESGASVNQSIPASSELHTISRTITASGVSAGEQISWILNRAGGDGSDTLNENLFVRFGPWLEYTAFF